MKKIIKRIKNNKILLFLGVLIVGILLLLLSRVTYAFFVAQFNSDLKNAIVDVDNLDELKFDIGDPINIVATPTTLPAGGTNLEFTTTASASLKANDTNNHAQYPYYFYLTLKNNTFVYSDGSTPEIILSVTKTNADGTITEVTAIKGLEYATYNGVAGFDITTKNGVFLLGTTTLVSDSSTTATVDNWSVKVTYLNLPTVDQTVNFDNSMITELSMKKNEILASHIANLYTTDGENGLYLHDGKGTYADYEAGDNSYRYTGASASVNNYVCFGSDAITCPEDNLYRIIGVFNENVIGEDGNPTGEKEARAKLIKNTKSTTMAWDTKGEYGTNTWSTSDMKTYLNDEYLTSLGSFSDKIAQTTWKVGGNTWEKIVTTAGVKNVYDAEIINPIATNSTDGKIEDTFKVGLMYVSEYMYAADPKEKDAWSALMGYNKSDATKDFRVVTATNWMFSGTYEWTISRRASHSSDVFRVYDYGNVFGSYAYYTFGGRPSFYLSSDVTITGGNGKSDSPYRIA